METYDKPENKVPLFAKLDGTPAHALVIIGFVLALFAPLVPNLNEASAVSASAAVGRAQAMVELDLEDFRRVQEAERKAEAEKQKDLDKRLDDERKSDEANAALSPAQRTSRTADRQRRSDELRKDNETRENARQKVASDKRDELEKKYNLSNLKREAIEALASSVGTRWNLFIGWLGTAFMLIGLLVLVAQSEGTRQKVLLVVLVLVMFSALAGLTLNFRAEGRMGDNTPRPGQVGPPPPPAPPMSTPTPAPTPTPTERIFIPPNFRFP